MKTVTINPVTRLEGHGKISIFLNDEGNVENAYFQVPELRGFEKFCEGRRVEEMPDITSRICGVCPEAHHLASTKTLDAVFHVDPPPTGEKTERATLQRLLRGGSHNTLLHPSRPRLRDGTLRPQSGTEHSRSHRESRPGTSAHP